MSIVQWTHQGSGQCLSVEQQYRSRVGRPLDGGAQKSRSAGWRFADLGTSGSEPDNSWPFGACRLLHRASPRIRLSGDIDSHRTAKTGFGELHEDDIMDAIDLADTAAIGATIEITCMVDLGAPAPGRNSWPLAERASIVRGADQSRKRGPACSPDSCWPSIVQALAWETGVAGRSCDQWCVPDYAPLAAGT